MQRLKKLLLYLHKFLRFKQISCQNLPLARTWQSKQGEGGLGGGGTVTDCLIAHSDGINKHGNSYTVSDIVNQEGKLLVCGIWKFGAADAQSQLDLFYEILGDICSSLENKDEVINKTF